MASTRHWRAGIDKPIAVLRLEPTDLEKLGLRFEDDYDELDDLRHARVETANGRRFALVRHNSAPKPGTEVVTSVESTTLTEDLDAVLARLRLTHDDVLWKHPVIKEAEDVAVATARMEASRRRSLRRLRLLLILCAAQGVALIGNVAILTSFFELKWGVRESLAFHATTLALAFVVLLLIDLSPVGDKFWEIGSAGSRTEPKSNALGAKNHSPQSY